MTNHSRVFHSLQPSKRKRVLRHRVHKRDYRFSARREQVPPRGADVRAAQLREVHDAGEEEAVRVEAPRHALCVFNKATSITLHNTP